ncbi:MAG: hypothetical protein IT306_06325 [Chloroflexi bacterium]|nr:hypothetical protein [Chloroflexota bacterium]
MTVAATEARSRAEDLALLRRFEPVLRFNAGEAYLPQTVDAYVERCSLWVHHADGRDELLVERGKLTMPLLTAPRDLPAGSVLYLDFVDPLDLPELTALAVQEGVERLRGGTDLFRPHIGRLARLGYGSRLLAALFSLTLFMRGRVPGDTAAAATLVTRQMRKQHPAPVYYGRVLRDPRGWIVLQYWFFYAFNNWRSGFYGANDHEADWEMLCVYAYEREDGEIVPQWAAFSCHDFSGGDLRRRWDDTTELTLIGEHPVVHVGVGSHAGYFRPGDYIAEIELALFAPLARVVNLLRRFWVGTLRQAGVAARVSRFQLFRVPFVEYARGDGVQVGPGQEQEWSPVLLDPIPAWASQYRGLWGFYAQDPVGGEDSPAGPMYERNSSPRPSWQDPLAWAALDGVPTPASEKELLARRRVELLGRHRKIDGELTEHLDQLEHLNVDLGVLHDEPFLRGMHQQLTDRRSDLRRRIDALRDQHDETRTLVEAIEARQARLAAGESDPPRTHITKLATPVPEPSYRLRRLAELWSALSIAALMLGVLTLTVADRSLLGPHLLLLVIAFFSIDSLLRQQVGTFVSRLAIMLSGVCGLILVMDFAWQILVGVIVVAVFYLAWTNVREVFR